MSQVAASCPGRPSQASRTLAPGAKGVRTRRRSKPWWPVMSSSSVASEGTGSSGVTSSTSSGDAPAPATSVTRARSLTSPLGSRRISVRTSMPWTASVPRETTTSASPPGPVSAVTSWKTSLMWAEKAEPSWR